MENFTHGLMRRRWRNQFEETISLLYFLKQATLNSDKKYNLQDIPPADAKPKVIFKPYCQSQEFLLPKSLNDFISPGHIARLLSDIIDRMDIKFIVDTYKGGGTSAYEPRMLLKSWILAFIYRIYSSRLVAKNLRENLAFIYISGNQTPDFHTLNNFRLRLKDDIKRIFKQIVIYGIEAGIIEGKDVFVDHTKNEANANKHKIVWSRQVNKQLDKIDIELDELFEHIDKINEDEERIFGDKDLPEQERIGFDSGKVQEVISKINSDMKIGKITKEDGKGQKQKVRRVRELLERKANYLRKQKILDGRNSYSKTDHDAVAMMMKDKLTIRPAYNEGIAVENGFVLDYIISDSCADSVSFVPLMEGVIGNLGKPPENANADSAYGNEEDYTFLDTRGIGNYLKFNTFQKEKSGVWRNKIFRLNDFRFGAGKNEFACPNGEILAFEKEKNMVTATGFVQKISVYRARDGACSNCPSKQKCTSAQSSRTLQVNWNSERLKEQARNNLNSPKGKELRRRRGFEVESVFGDQKLNKLKRRYHLRGLSKVNLEAGLYYISHNIRKIYRKINGKLSEGKEQFFGIEAIETGNPTGMIPFPRNNLAF